ncbi:uncharacterized protein FFM5_10467 [Fusarium fujikuroi]|nr:uncharacterized protein FFM5_10467 [Fusarium fujikuroi]
MLSSFMFTET